VTFSEQNTKWEGDICEKCGSKEFERWYDEGNDDVGDFNFMKCKKCGEVYLDD
jgi:predicted nucleic-acid-binding Zn-ribbon protein